MNNQEFFDEIDMGKDEMAEERESWEREMKEERDKIFRETERDLTLERVFHNLYQGVGEDSRIIINPRMVYKNIDGNGKGKYASGWNPKECAVISPKETEKIRKVISNKHCFFYGVNTVNKDLKTNHKNSDGVIESFKGKTSGKDIKEIVSLYADIDGVTEDEMYNRLKNIINIQPSIIIQSSNDGYHFYWLLKKPIEAQGNKSEVESVCQKLSNIVGSCKVQNIDRVLRLPESYHTKTGAPIFVKVLKNDGSIRYSLEDIGNILNSDMNKRQIKKQDVRISKDGEGKDYLPLSLDIQIEGLRLPANILDLIENYVPKGGRSEADMSIMNSLKWHGATRKLTHTIFENKPCGAKFRENGESYFNLTWDKAEANYAKGGSDKKGQVGTHEGEIDVASQSILTSFSLTDIGNGERFAVQNKDRVRYCFKWDKNGKWLVWTGKRWKIDDGEMVERLAKRTVKKIYDEAKNEPNPKVSRIIANHAVKSSSDNQRRAMIFAARSEKGLPIERWRLNQPRMLLNVKNGTVDLKTGTLREHKAEDFITQITPYNYNPQAKCPKWLSFLSDVMHGSQENIDYLQRAVGFSITGEISSQAFFILWGDGENGKSTFMNTIKGILGSEYSHQANRDTLIQKKFKSSATNDMADLRDVRLLYAHETESGERLNESFLKQVSGGENLRCRHLYSEDEEFEPTVKIWISSNYKPGIKGIDRGIWRRVIFIPWKYVVDPKKRIDDYHKVLLSEEGEGILAWAIEGAKVWANEKGLGKKPQEIEEATKEYESEMNPLDRFFEECLKKEKNSKIKSAELYLMWTYWARENQEYDMSSRIFNQKIATMGVKKDRKRDTNYYLDIDLSAEGMLILEKAQKERGQEQAKTKGA